MGEKIAVVLECADTKPMLAEWLREAHYAVTVYPYAQPVAETLHHAPPEGVVYVGAEATGPSQEALRAVREAVGVPILVVAPQVDEAYVVRALRLGADGCVPRACGRHEFLARLEALLRRHWEWQPFGCNTIAEEVRVDPDACQAVVGSREVKLTPTECRLLAYLAAHDGRVVPREELYDHVWGLDEAPSSPNTLNLYIFNLRRKLERDPHRPRHLLTKWGIGYYLLRRGHRA